MNVKQNDYALPVSSQLIAVIQKYIEQSGNNFTNGVVINFKDPEYSAEQGGFHPVEIALNEKGRLLYITDFSYVEGGPGVELAKELDFDFSQGLLQQFGVEYPITQGCSLYALWEKNFLSYHSIGVYQVTVEEL